MMLTLCIGLSLALTAAFMGRGHAGDGRPRPAAVAAPGVPELGRNGRTRRARHAAWDG
jgi:hypothetical protein